jgi:putrescine aminotransferase
MNKAFGPLLPEIHCVPYGDVSAVKSVISSDIGAVIVEPIQAEKGVVLPPAGYLRSLAGICSEASALLIVDEIKCGMGKTGRMFAWDVEDETPDAILVGKSLGGGVMPIGALVANSKWWTRFGLSFAMTASSSAGNRFACVAGLVTLEVIRSEHLCENAKRQGFRLLTRLLELRSSYPQLIKSVTGRGLLIGVRIANRKLAHGIILACVRGGVLLMPAFLDRTEILIEPPLCITETQIDQVYCALEEACKAVSAQTL